MLRNVYLERLLNSFVSRCSTYVLWLLEGPLLSGSWSNALEINYSYLRSYGASCVIGTSRQPRKLSKMRKPSKVSALVPPRHKYRRTILYSSLVAIKWRADMFMSHKKAGRLREKTCKKYKTSEVGGHHFEALGVSASFHQKCRNLLNVFRY